MLEFMTEKQSSWEKIKASGLPVVIYGMGNGADKILDEFIRLDIPVKGVTASDDFVRGQMFRGFRVKKLSEFDGEFIIAVAFATCLPPVMDHIYFLTEKYRVLVPVVPVYGNEIFNREFITAHSVELTYAYDLMHADSKKIFAGCVDFMFGGELSRLMDITTEKDEAFRGFFTPRGDEDYLDLGAYRGETVDELLNYSGGAYSSVTAVEPDKKTFSKLCSHLENLENCETVNKAVWSFSGELLFDSAAGRQSSVSDKGKAVNAETVDGLCENKRVSYIKMDVEGAEYEALNGGAMTLKNQKPRLNIALYHRSEDIFRLPLLIRSLNPAYEFHLRRHPYIPCWDMNLYCI